LSEEIERAAREMVVALIPVTDLNRIVQTGRFSINGTCASSLCGTRCCRLLAAGVDPTPISPWQPFHARSYAIRRVHAPLHQQAAE
jgi:hypothetical protein